MSERSDIEDFVRTITLQRLAYFVYLKMRGYEFDFSEIDELRADVATKSPGKSPMELAVEELQTVLALVDGFESPQYRNLKATLYAYGRTKLRMRPEQNHGRPHFHLEYKTEYSASYAIDTLERLAGSMPKKYEEPMLVWASQYQKELDRTWEALARGDDVRELVLCEDV